MHAADVFASPSTREGFGITFAEAMAADCTVLAADHPESAAGEVIDGAGFVVPPTDEAVREALDVAVAGKRPTKNPKERAQTYDWDNVTTQAEQIYQHAINTRA